MAEDGLRSIKYGVGNQAVINNNPITLENMKRAGLFAADMVSPAYDIQEYKQGVEQTLSGDLYGIPRAATGLLGMAVPGSKYISKAAKKAAKKITPSKKPLPKVTAEQEENFIKSLLDPSFKEKIGTRTYPNLPVGKEIKAYHGTKEPFKGEGFQTGTGVLFVSPNPKFADSFMRSKSDFKKYEAGARTYPLRINKNANIFDPTDEKQFNELLKNKRFKAWVKRNNKIYNDGAPSLGEPTLNEKQFLKTLKENEFYEEGAGNFLEHEDLHPILKDLGYDGFTMRESDTTNIGIFLNDEGTSSVLKTLDQKFKGGRIMSNPYDNYNTQRTI
tara:strand:- start:524 stop:1513 length:990 start_codon:yes stop_codon:yes gene_type:complete